MRRVILIATLLSVSATEVGAQVRWRQQLLAVLGKDCASARRTMACQNDRCLCARDGRVAGGYTYADFIIGDERGAEVLVKTRLPGGRQMSLVVWVRDRLLWARQITCGICRRIMGWGFAGDPSRLRDEDLRDLQRRLRLVGRTPLRTLDAWRAAFRAIPRRYQLWIQIDSPLAPSAKEGSMVLAVAGREIHRGPLRRQGSPMTHVHYGRVEVTVESASSRVRVRLEAPELKVVHEEELDLERGRVWIVSWDARRAKVKIQQRLTRPMYR